MVFYKSALRANLIVKQGDALSMMLIFSDNPSKAYQLYISVYLYNSATGRTCNT